VLSFLPAGKVRSAAEHLVAAVVGALLLFVFFMASEIAVQVMQDTPLMPVTFIPVICLLPILAGALAVIVFEKLRKTTMGIRRGALVGALAGLFGSMVSSLPLLILTLIKPDRPAFGDMLASPLLVALVLIVTIGLDTLLAAIGGALVVKFTSDK